MGFSRGPPTQPVIPCAVGTKFFDRAGADCGHTLRIRAGDDSGRGISTANPRIGVNRGMTRLTQTTLR
jgi:hypothetical protein